MAIRKYIGDRITCLSSDTKPTNMADGAILLETNTNRQYQLSGGAWLLISDSTELSGITADLSALSGDVSTNTTNISNNLSDITTLSGDVATNAGNISTNTTNISNNDADIVNLSGDVATNAGNISTNTTNISNNDADIVNLSGDVATNAGNIATNTADIATVSGSVISLANDVSTNYQAISEKGNADGYAELDSGGKVPIGQLPSYVDSVQEFANVAAFPVTGETGIIYVALDTNLTYRWSGSIYVEISPSLALGETSGTAYRGDRGKIAYDNSIQNISDIATVSGDTITNAANISTNTTNISNNDADIVNLSGDVSTNASNISTLNTEFDTHTGDTANPHSVTATQVGLGNVDNTSDADKPISTATQTALDLKVDLTGLTGNNVELASIGGAAYTSVQQMQDVYHSTGLITGGVITDGGSGTINVTAGEGYIRPTDSDVAELQAMAWGAVNGLALTNDLINYIYVEYNAGTPQVIATTTKRADTNTNLLLGNVFRDLNELHIGSATSYDVGDHATKMIKRLQATAPFAKESGGVISEVGTRNLAISAGLWWEGLKQFSTPVINTLSGDTFIYNYRDGSGGWTEIDGSTTVNNLQYDDGTGTLATLSNSRYGVHWVFLASDGTLHLVYGQIDSTLTDAETKKVPTALPPYFLNYARLIGKLIIAKSSATITQIISAFSASLVGSSGLQKLSDDVNPTLGGNLITGIYTVDGRDVSTDGTKLDTLRAPSTSSGTTIGLSNYAGNYMNMSSANSTTTYTTSGQTVGGYAIVRINAATEPTITGATKIKGSDFIADTDMHMIVQYFGVTTQYFFVEL